MQGDEKSSRSELRQPSCTVLAIGATPVQAGRVSGRGRAGSRAAQWVSASLLTSFFSHPSYALQSSSGRTQVTDHRPGTGMTPEMRGSRVRVAGGSSIHLSHFLFYIY